jgi:hypothetical protein
MSRPGAARWTSIGKRWGGGAGLVGALCAAGAVVASCDSPPTVEPTFPAFVLEDCRGGLVEVARFRRTFSVKSWEIGTHNNLALDGETLYVTYAFAAEESGLPLGGGIVAVPVSGGAARAVTFAEGTLDWGAGTFWIGGGRIYLQTGTNVLSFPVDSPPLATLPVKVLPALNTEYAHDADFGYVAQAEDDLKAIKVMKTPLAGGDAAVLLDEQLPNVALGGMADAGDALLLQVRWGPDAAYESEAFTRVWRIPKDGSPRSDVRPDIVWADVVGSAPYLGSAQWLAWDGADILGPIYVQTHVVIVQNYLVIARVPAAGRSAPEYLKLYGAVAARRGDEILSLQTLAARAARTPEVTGRLLVASSRGAPAGSVIACGAEFKDTFPAGQPAGLPAGIAANDSAVFVSYMEGEDTVIARVEP